MATRTVWVNSLLDSHFQECGWHDSWNSPYGAGSLKDIAADVLKITDSWGTESSEGWAPDHIPSGRVLAFRNIGIKSPPGSCAPADFPVLDMRDICNAFRDSIGFAERHATNCDESTHVAIQRVFRRVRRWDHMGYQAHACRFWRVRFDGVHEMAIKILELSQVVRATRTDIGESDLATWRGMLERTDRLARKWAERHG